MTVRAVLLGVLIWGAGCSVRQQCAASCEGCCDGAGKCHPGSDPFACGGQGDCKACLAGQGCSGGACVGSERGSALQLGGNNTFVALSGQGFHYAESNSAFVLLSELDRKVCRDPLQPPNVDEQVLLISMPHPGVEQFERLIFRDGGVERVAVVGSANLQVMNSRIVGTVRVEMPNFRVNGMLDVPVCGALR